MIIPFSKPSPFSSITDWQELANKQPALQQLIFKELWKMSDDTVYRFNDELAKFKKTMDEVNLLKGISEDLKSFRRMIKLKKYD